LGVSTDKDSSDQNVEYYHGQFHILVKSWRFGTNITIPQQLSSSSELFVSEISPSAFASSPIQKVALPETIEVISKSCFHGCLSFVEISFPPTSRLQRIESQAFTYSSLKTISIPASVKVVGKSAFAFCRCLERVTFCDPSSCRELRSFAFKLCTKLTQIHLPESLEVIGTECFFGDSVLRSISWGDRPPRFIGKGAFHGCDPMLSAPKYEDAEDSILDTEPESQQESEIVRSHGPVYEKSYEDIFFFFNEFNILFDLRHPCIVRCLGSVPGTADELPRLVLDSAPTHTLSEFLSGASGSQTAAALVGIADAMCYLHSKGIAYRHLTTGTLMFDEDFRPYLCDFSESRRNMSSEDANHDVDCFGTIIVQLCLRRENLVDGDRTLDSEEIDRAVTELSVKATKTLVTDCSQKRIAFPEIVNRLMGCDFVICGNADSNQVRKLLCGFCTSDAKFHSARLIFKA
jgi:hypothetical protein